MSRRGLALVVILLAIALLAVAGGAVASLGSRSLWLSRAGADREQALLAADAGLALTSEQLLLNPGFGGFPKQALRVTQATYTTTVTHGPGFAINGVSVPDGLHYILAEGSYKGQTREVGLMVIIATSDFKMAAFAAENINLRHNVVVESYDSSQGPYPAGRGGNADIATNSKADSSVLLTDGSEVHGDVFTGPGSGPNTVVQEPSARIFGAVRELNRKRVLSPVTLPADPSAAADLEYVGGITALPPGVYGDLVLRGGATLQLDAGAPYVFNSVVMQGDSNFELAQTISAPVQLFVAANFDMSGGSVVNKTMRPAMLRFLATGDDILVNGKGTDAYFVVYAPESHISVESRGQIMGSIVGEKIILKDDSKLSYDKALKDEVGFGTDVLTVSRQEF